jgi:hypothetical protein
MKHVDQVWETVVKEDRAWEAAIRQLWLIIKSIYGLFTVKAERRWWGGREMTSMHV